MPDVDCINPRDDPEIIWLAGELKKFKSQLFYGTIALQFENGVLKRFSSEQMHKLPVGLVPTPGR